MSSKMDSTEQHRATKVLRRQRQSLNCEPCRKKKCRCDRQLPCDKCIRSRNERCVYATIPETSASTIISSGATTTRDTDEGSGHRTLGDKTRPSATSTPGEWQISTLVNYLVQKPDDAKEEKVGREEGEGVSDVYRYGVEAASQKPSQVPEMMDKIEKPVRNIMVKSRYLSPSSWIYCCLIVCIYLVYLFRPHGLVKDRTNTMQVPHILAWLEDKGPKQGEYPELFKECRVLYKQLMLQRTLHWTPGHHGLFLPTRELGTMLMNSYLRTFETIYRVFHMPTLLLTHENLWDEAKHTNHDCLVQLQLCFALGALTNDDAFQFRYHAIQWIKEGEYWLDQSAKPRPTIATIQTMCLLTLAREHTQGTYGDKVYIHSGALLRAAISIGLHRDPDKLPQIPIAQAEMRRRIWATVLELVLDSCLDSGSPPLISVEDFDCQLPANLDDSQLHPDGTGQATPTPHPPNVFTDTTLQIALGNLFANRLAIARYANGIALDEMYDDTMKMSADYNSACRAVIDSLQSMQDRISPFQRRYCEMVITRYIFTLHIPYLTLSTRNPQYLLSGKACLEAALNITACGLKPSQSPLLSDLLQANQVHDDFVRLSLNSSGVTRSIIFQSCMIILAGLIAIIKESRSSFLWSDSTRALHNPRAQEYLSILRQGARWSKERLEAGSGHNRDHLVMHMAVRGSEAMLEIGNVDEALKSGVIQACEEMRDAYASLIDMSNLCATSDQTTPEVDAWGFTDLWMGEHGQLDLDLAYF